MNSIELHIFTNSTVSAPTTQMIEQTYSSFVNTFGAIDKVTVWCDPHPNTEQGQQYLANLKEIFPTVNQTNSLSDGYVKAVNLSTADFMFMLEHDWDFLSGITHSLDTMMTVMTHDDLLHMRFNKRANVAKKSDRDLAEVANTTMPYCTTRFLSNNPHIINRKKYIQHALPLIHVREKTFGIEKDLSCADLTGTIYGPMNHPATVAHTDGKTFKADSVTP
jgi:hypothetical protein